MLLSIQIIKQNSGNSTMKISHKNNYWQLKLKNMNMGLFKSVAVKPCSLKLISQTLSSRAAGEGSNGNTPSGAQVCPPCR